MKELSSISPPCEQEGPLPAPPLTVRRLPLRSAGGWHWLRLRPQQPTATPSMPVMSVARPRRMRRCGRGVLIWVMMWYGALLTIPFLLNHRWQRIGPAHEAKKWPALRQLIADYPDRPLLVMLGSSRGCWAFRAGCLDGMKDTEGRPLSVFNFGIPATGPISELFNLRDMLAEGIRPEYVLIEFLPPLLCEAQRGALTEEGMMGFEGLNASRFLKWLPYLYRKEKRGHLWLESRLNPWHVFRRQIQLELRCLAEGKPFPTYEPIDHWGWHISMPVPYPAELRKQRLKMAHGGYSPGLGKFRLGKKPTQALHEILDLCRTENIRAALVLMPESSEFRGWYSDDANTAIHGLLDELSQSYNVPVIDAQCWLADDDFEDGHHTLLHGADVFTYRLHAELPRLFSAANNAKSD